MAHIILVMPKSSPEDIYDASRSKARPSAEGLSQTSNIPVCWSTTMSSARQLCVIGKLAVSPTALGKFHLAVTWAFTVTSCELQRILHDHIWNRTVHSHNLCNKHVFSLTPKIMGNSIGERDWKRMPQLSHFEQNGNPSCRLAR